jgi:tetratricopeptide (TPR) repeat protein
MFFVPFANAAINAGVSIEEYNDAKVNLLPKINLSEISKEYVDISYWTNYRPLNMLSGNETYKIDKKKNFAPLSNIQDVKDVYEVAFSDLPQDNEDLKWTQTIETHQNRPEYLYAYSMYLKNKEDYTQALNNLDKAIALDKNYALAYFLKGDIYRILGEYKNAVLSYLETIKINPFCTDAYFNIAKIFEEFDAIDLALDFYGYAYITNPNDIEVRNNILKLRKRVASN